MAFINTRGLPSFAQMGEGVQKFYEGVLGSRRAAPSDPQNENTTVYKSAFMDALDQKVVPVEVVRSQQKRTFLASYRNNLPDELKPVFDKATPQQQEQLIAGQIAATPLENDITLRQFVNNELKIDRFGDNKFMTMTGPEYEKVVFDQLARHFSGRDVAPAYQELATEMRKAVGAGVSQFAEDEMMGQDEFEARPGTSMFGETYRSKKNIPTENEGINLNRRRVFNLLSTGKEDDYYTGATANLMRLPGFAFGEADTSAAIGQELAQSSEPDGYLKTKADMFNRGRPRQDGSMPPKRAMGRQFNPLGLSQDYYEGAGLPNYESESKLPAAQFISLLGGDDPTQGVAWQMNKISPSRQVIQRQHATNPETGQGENARPLQELTRTYGKAGIIPRNLDPTLFRTAVDADEKVQERSDNWWARNESDAVRAVRTALGGDPNKYQSPVFSNMIQLPGEIYHDPTMFGTAAASAGLGVAGKSMKPLLMVPRGLVTEELPEEGSFSLAAGGQEMLKERDKLPEMGDVGRGDAGFDARRKKENLNDIEYQNIMNVLSHDLGIPTAKTGRLSPDATGIATEKNRQSLSRKPEDDERERENDFVPLRPKKKFDASGLFETQF